MEMKMKMKKRATLAEQLTTLRSDYNSIVSILDRTNYDLLIAGLKIQELEKDKRWLQQLVQEMSSTMNNGSKEATFPRR